MKYSGTMRITNLLMAALVLSIFISGQAFAAVTWLSSIPVKVIGSQDDSAPARLALDSNGNIYVTDRRSNNNRVIVFDRSGKLVTAKGGFSSPVSIAVDVNGNIYVGNAETGSVDVYTSDFTFSRKLGIGDNEFKFPSSISAVSDGRIFVADKTTNVIKVYNPDGTPAFSFSGQNDAGFNEPYGLAIDEKAGEIYVTDRPLITITDDYGAQTLGGARVQVFDMYGGLKNSFGEFGSGQGQMNMPLGIAADGSGKLYVTDAGLGAVHVFTASGTWVETVSDSARLKTPVGIVIGKDQRMFVACSHGASIEAYALDGYTAMAVSTASLNFSIVEGGPNPAAQNATVSNNGFSDLSWSAAASTADGVKWLNVTQSGTTAAGSSSALSVSLTINALVLPAGSYSGTVTVTGSGTQETISVILDVLTPPAVLSVTPGSLSFKAQQNGPVPMSKSFAVTNAGGGSMTWSASTTASWLELDVNASMLIANLKTTSLDPGTYTGSVTITAPNAQGSPLNLNVTVEIVQTGTVKVSSNIDNASFNITGSETYDGSGKSWSNDDVKPGVYTIAFNQVSGYLKPVAREFTIETGKETAITADYRAKALPNHVVAGSAEAGAEMKVSIQPLESGKMPRSFTAFSSADSVRVASGDLDGSGSDKVVVTDYNRTVKVFSDQGGEPLASYELPQEYKHADVVVGDIDNDGSLDMLVWAENQKSGRIIKALSYAANALEEKVQLFTEDKAGEFDIALGDVNGDGTFDLVLVDGNSVRAFTVEQAAITQTWSRSGDYGVAPQIAAGDVNNDGIYEIAVSYEHAKEAKGRNRNRENRSLIRILTGSGEDFGLTIEPFSDLGYTKAATIAMGDIDGDGADELAAGAGPSDENEPVIRIYESDGIYAGVTMKPLNGKNGVNVGLGKFQ